MSHRLNVSSTMWLVRKLASRALLKIRIHTLHVKFLQIFASPKNLTFYHKTGILKKSDGENFVSRKNRIRIALNRNMCSAARCGTFQTLVVQTVAHYWKCATFSGMKTQNFICSNNLRYNSNSQVTVLLSVRPNHLLSSLFY